MHGGLKGSGRRRGGSKRAAACRTPRLLSCRAYVEGEGQREKIWGRKEKGGYACQNDGLAQVRIRTPTLPARKQASQASPMAALSSSIEPGEDHATMHKHTYTPKNVCTNIHKHTHGRGERGSASEAATSAWAEVLGSVAGDITCNVKVNRSKCCICFRHPVVFCMRPVFLSRTFRHEPPLPTPQTMYQRTLARWHHPTTTTRTGVATSYAAETATACQGVDVFNMYHGTATPSTCHKVV